MQTTATTNVNLRAKNLNPGMKLFLQTNVLQKQFTHSPLILGEDYDFTPAYRGRPGCDAATRDCGLFTALKPLVVAMVSPWRDETGCASLAHIRAARHDGGFADIAAMDPENRIRTRINFTKAAGDFGKKSVFIEGGFPNAVVYQDEWAVPAYRWSEDQKFPKPFAYIVRMDEWDSMRANHRNVIETERAEKSLGIDWTPESAFQRRLGQLVLTLDEKGFLHKLESEEKGKTRKLFRFIFNNGVSIQPGQLISAPALRKALGLDAQPTIITSVETIHSAAEAVPVNPLSAAFSAAEQQTRQVPMAPRPRAVTIAKLPVEPEPVVAAPVPEPPTAEPEALVLESQEVTSESQEVTSESQEVTSESQEVTSELVAESVVVQSTEGTPLSDYADQREASAFIAQEVEAVVTAASDPRITLLLEEFAGKLLPEILDGNGEVFVPQDAILDIGLATRIIEDPNSLMPTASSAETLSRIYEICAL